MTTMISPGISSYEYMLNMLRYTDRVKELSPHSGPSGEQSVQMETEVMEASSNGTSLAGNEEEELSSQMSSFNEAMTQIRELEERALEELREIIQVRTGSSQGGIGRPLSACRAQLHPCSIGWAGLLWLLVGLGQGSPLQPALLSLSSRRINDTGSPVAQCCCLGVRGSCI